MEDSVTAADAKKGRLGAPFEDPISSLPKTARKILVAARQILVERGYEAMTLENIAAEAGVNKSSIRYNFGNKAGLVIAVVDAYIHDECLNLAADIRHVPEQDRLDTAINGMRNMLVEADSFKGFYDILPHAFRDAELRERMLALYKWWYAQNLAWLGLAGAPGAEQDPTLLGLAELVCAVIDGICVQAGLQPEGFDMGRPLAVFGLLLENSMDQLREVARRATETAATTDI